MKDVVEIVLIVLLVLGFGFTMIFYAMRYDYRVCKKLYPDASTFDCLIHNP